MTKTLSMALPSGGVMKTNSSIYHLPIVISTRTLYIDLVILEMFVYDIILGIDFLKKKKNGMSTSSVELIKLHLSP